MKIQFACECGTTVDMPEKLAGKGCSCPGCRKVMVPVDARTGQTRLEIPFIEKTIDENAHPQTRKQGRAPSRASAPHHKKKGIFATLPRSIGLVAAIAFVTLLSVWITVRPNGEQDEKPGIKKEQYEGTPVKKEQSALPVVPQAPKGDLAKSQEKMTTTPATVQSGGHGPGHEPSAYTLAAQEDALKKLPLPPPPEGLKGEVPLVQPLPNEPSRLTAGQPAVPPAEEKKVDTAAKDKASAATVARVSPKPKPPPTSPPAKGQFTLNVASFKEMAKAEEYRDELKAQGVDAFYWAIRIPGQGTWYRVSVGNFPTREGAEIFAKKLEKNLQIKPVVAEVQ